MMECPRDWIRAAVRAAVSILCVCVLAIAPAAAAGDERETIRFEIPLEGGVLDVGSLLEDLWRRTDLEPIPGLDAMDWSIDVHGASGAGALRGLSRLLGEGVTFEVDDDRLAVAVNRAAIRQHVGDTVGAVLPRAGSTETAEAAPAFGLTMVTGAEAGRPVAGMDHAPDRLVVLIHGLDDPGWMWRDLIPALEAAGFAAARFEYPNDGPISDATDLLARHLADARRAGVHRVDLVAHSMGGLVSRDLLTRPAYYDGDGRGHDRFPAVGRLIMLGTPNHGSHMARLRFVSELNEQISRAISGDGAVGGATTDGNGEAAVDLLPGSDFLRRLNRRDHPTGTEMTIVAGRVSPVSEEMVDDLLARAGRLAESESAPTWLREWLSGPEVGAASRLLGGAVRAVGDGVVAVDSARLDGVEDVEIVQANHLSMLATTLVSTAKTPPAVPIVIERLRRADAITP